MSEQRKMGLAEFLYGKGDITPIEDVRDDVVNGLLESVESLEAERDRYEKLALDALNDRERLKAERVAWELGLQDKLDAVTGERDRLIQGIGALVERLHTEAKLIEDTESDPSLLSVAATKRMDAARIELLTTEEQG